MLWRCIRPMARSSAESATSTFNLICACADLISTIESVHPAVAMPVIDASSQMKPHPNRAKHFPKSIPQPPFYRASPKSNRLTPPRPLMNPQGPSSVRFRHVHKRPLNFPKYWQIQISWPYQTILRAQPQVAFVPLLRYRHFQNRPVMLMLFPVAQWTTQQLPTHPWSFLWQ
jgi:hypothetical protein